MQCTHCGSSLSAEDLRAADCKYCGTVLPHHAKAAEKAALVQQLLGDANGNGIPDAFEGALGAPGPASGGGGFVSVHGGSGGMAASVRVTAVRSSAVVVRGEAQADGAIRGDVAKALRSAGAPVASADARRPAKSVPWVAVWVVLVLGAISVALIRAALS